MAIAGYFVVCIIGLVLTAAGLAQTPDADRPRAYPKEPERWSGVGPTPGTTRDAFRSQLLYTLGLAVSGGVGALFSAWMPWRAPASLVAALAVGVLASAGIARRWLRAGPGAMRRVPKASKAPLGGERPRVLFIGGSPNQTTQMHRIACALPEVDCWFTPYFSDHWGYRLLVKLGLIESTILGLRRRGLCLDHLNAHGLRVDFCAERNDYDLFVSCNDQVIPPGLAAIPWILVQEGIQEPPSWRTRLWRATRAIPMPLAGTATFGLSERYTRFCVASEGYRRRYLEEGIDPEKIVVTGIPNFDDFARFRENSFPHKGYVLVCTSDARETLLAADRRALLEQAVEIASGRQLIFKLHPNERVERATREIRAMAPDALIFSDGVAEEMVANCDVLVTEWSSLTFCGVALGKEVHSLHSMDEVKQLLPLQHGRAAREIADVVRSLLARVRADREDGGTDEHREVA